MKIIKISLILFCLFYLVQNIEYSKKLAHNKLFMEKLDKMKIDDLMKNKNLIEDKTSVIQNKQREKFGLNKNLENRLDPEKIIKIKNDKKRINLSDEDNKNVKNNTRLRLQNGYKSSKNKTSSSARKEYKGICFTKINSKYFDLYPIEKLGSELSLKINDEDTLVFNICENVFTGCRSDPGLAVTKSECLNYANDTKLEKTWKLSYFLNEQGKNTSLLTLNLPQGDLCDEDTNFSLVYNLQCDENTEKVEILNSDDYDNDSCTNTIRMKTKYACEKSEYSPWHLKFGLNKIIIAAILIVIGLFISLIGAKYFNYIVCLLVISMGGLLTKSLLANYLNLSPYVLWGISFLISIGVGVLCFFIIQIVVVAAFMFLAYFISQFLLGILVLHTSMDPMTLFFILFIATMLMLGILTYVLTKLLEVLLTSVIGSYALIRGISLILGGFPDEEFLSALLTYKEINQIKRIMTGEILKYIIALILYLIISLVIQVFTSDDKDKKNDNKKNKK